MISELKAFLLRGDVLALSVAVIIGGAFQKIVDSLVNDVISPLLALLIGRPDFSDLVLGPLQVGRLLTAIVHFLMIGTLLFFLVKAAGQKTSPQKQSS